MVTIEIDQRSLNQTIRNLDKLGNKKHKEAEKIVRRSAYKIASGAKNGHLFKNRTGRLQSSIHVEWIKKKSSTYSCDLGSFDGSLNELFEGNLGHNIGSNVEYAGDVHDGISGRKADPYLQRPFYQEKSKMEAKLKKLVNEKW